MSIGDYPCTKHGIYNCNFCSGKIPVALDPSLFSNNLISGPHFHKSNDCCVCNEKCEFDPIVIFGEENLSILDERVKQIAINALNDLQGKWFLWKEKIFGESTGKGPEWQALGMAEEVGEVCRIVLKAHQKIRQYPNGFDEKAKNNLAKEIADVAIFSIQLCSVLGIDFGKTLFERSEEVMKRDPKAYRENGE